MLSHHHRLDKKVASPVTEVERTFVEEVEVPVGGEGGAGAGASGGSEGSVRCGSGDFELL